MLVTFGLILSLLFAASARWWFGYVASTWLADLGDGTLYTNTVSPSQWSTPLPGWFGGPNVTYSPAGTLQSWTWTWWHWGPRSPTGFPDGNAYTVWPLAPALILIGAIVGLPGFRAARRLRRDCCPHCGYSRESLPPDAPCPECGKPVMVPPAEPQARPDAPA